MESTSSTRNGSIQITRWLLGVFASVIALGVGIVITTLISISSRINLVEIQASSNLEKLKHIEASTLSLVPDKIEYITKHADLVSKVAYTENAIKLLESRTSSISEKVLAMATRLDAVILLTDDFKSKIKSRE